MANDYSFAYLADLPEAVPVLTQWFITEWRPYYGSAGPGDAEQDLTSCCHRDQIPLALVALDAASDVVGTAALKPDSLPTHRHLSPWLAALLVAPEYRGRGLASALIGAIETEARRLGFATIYSDTAAGSTLLGRRGWQQLETGVPTLREATTVYRCDLGGAPDTTED